MIHYHGLPITPDAACSEVAKAGHVFVSHAYPTQAWLAVDLAQSFALDNGAFSAWRGGAPVTDWQPFYDWADRLRRVPSCDFAVIPDVIDGSESDNDRLVGRWPFGPFGAPVWHLHEGITRLVALARTWPRVCLGSSGQYAEIGTDAWWHRMADAFDAITDADGYPVCKVHGLRMLAPVVVEAFPFASADSTNIGQNIGLDGKWNGAYSPANKATRALVMRGRIEAFNAPQRWNRQAAQRPLASPLFREGVA